MLLQVVLLLLISSSVSVDRSHSSEPPRCSASPSPTASPSASRISSAVARRSLPRWPQAASLRIARVRSSIATAVSAGVGAPSAPLRGGAGSPLHSSRSSARRSVDDRLGLGALLGLGAQRRDPHREPEVGRAAALEQEAEGQQVVVQRLEHHVALQSRLEARDRPGQRACHAGAVLPRSPERGRAVGEHARQRRQVAQLLLGEAVAPSPGAAGAGRDPPPAIGACARPGIRPQSDAAGLKEAKRGDQLAKGLDGAGAGVRRWLSALVAPPRRR